MKTYKIYNEASGEWEHRGFKPGEVVEVGSSGKTMVFESEEQWRQHVTEDGLLKKETKSSEFVNPKPLDSWEPSVDYVTGDPILESVTMGDKKYVVKGGDLLETKKPASERQAGGSHYKDLAIQPQIFCQKNKLNGMETAAIKYICRHNLDTGKPGGALDIRKAIHMLELLLETDYNEEVLK